MKRRIVLSLLFLVGCSVVGALVAVRSIRETREELQSLIRLHQIEEMRQALMIAIQASQSDLLSLNTSLGRKADAITDNVLHLERSARKCTTCHHEPQVAARIDALNRQVSHFEADLSYFITASADEGRIEKLKAEAAVAGMQLLKMTEQMSVEATLRLEQRTERAMRRIYEVEVLLKGVSLAVILLAVGVAVSLTRTVTRPVARLIQATRAIAAGQLGFETPVQDRTEFGELAKHFNKMSRGLKEMYEELQGQIQVRVQAEEALRKSEERYALAARGANDGLWDWNLRTQAVFYSTRWKEMLGWADHEVGTAPEEWLGRIHPEDRARVDALLASRLKGGEESFATEYRIRHRDGTDLWVMCRGIVVPDETGSPVRIAGSQTDITARKKAEEQLLFDALHDTLTGLANRALFHDRLERALAAARRHGGRTSGVLFVDLDRFKVLNDTLGHVTGDHILVEVAHRLIGTMRPGDTVARFGGDEFAILVENITGLPEALGVVERLQEDLGKGFTVDGHEVFVKASIGVALCSDRHERALQVLRDADIAMYQAKARGGSTHEVFDASMHESVLDRLRLEADLRRGLEHEEFVLHYQPIVEGDSGKPVAMEALLRWKHPERGLIQPSDFIPIAEVSGAIVPIGEWALRTACRDMRAWTERNPRLASVRLSMNMSGRQFRQPDIVTRVCDILQETRLDPNQLCLEVTETMIMGDVDAGRAKLDALRALGVHVHLDDFGTGYSSLSYLHRFPINALKIDQSFVARLGREDGSESLILAIVSIAASLGLEVIAEGVEDPSQLEHLRELGCQIIQGFHFAHPMPAEAAEAYFQEGLPAPPA
ncbi:MAG: EAL domain-containing protein [Acidobacteria bacterium]|nr:EAL domain-containing protein [Acidobacteriota bacterium]